MSWHGRSRATSERAPCYWAWKFALNFQTDVSLSWMLAVSTIDDWTSTAATCHPVEAEAD